MRYAGPTGVDLEKMAVPLENICSYCDYKGTPGCKEPECLVGFARRVLRYAVQKGLLDIPGASSLIPKGDFKHYYPEALVPALTETCRQCKECRDNHNPDCVVALVRSSVEFTVLSDIIPYPGSVFMYLARIKDQNSELAAFLAGELSKKNG